jgi:hypothetical protein
VSEKTTLGKARGLNKIADPRQFKGSSGRSRLTEVPPPPPEPPSTPAPAVAPEPRATPVREEPIPSPPPVPHRAVTPGVQRKRRELSIPRQIAEALAQTGINPADIVMAGYRKHSDAIFSGAAGRIMARGRTRLRLSISDSEFEQLTRLGHARGWNRSETVSVILALELLGDAAHLPAGSPPRRS